jgi:formylglycine-generating enzyme required for sulfatase activity
MEYAMELIEAGTFLMGSPAEEEGRYDDETQHRVTLTKSFYMGKYVVTQAQYTAVMGSYPNTAPNAESGRGANHPMYNVSWYDALVFCNTLSIQEHLTPAYTIKGSTNPDDWGTVPTENSDAAWDAVVCDWNADGYRLPTEAEWEYACRAGTTTAYNTGSDAITDNTGWYWDNSRGKTTRSSSGIIFEGQWHHFSVNSGRKTHAVGKKPANALGLYDMHGNICEWCWDWYDEYADGDQTDPKGASTRNGVPQTDRVIRGGSWFNNGEDLRSACRNELEPHCHGSFGFRLVRSVV